MMPAVSSVSLVLLLSALMFAIGAAGVLIRKNLLVVLMCLELMLNGANLAFAAFARSHGDSWGHLGVLVGLAIAGAEAAVGLGIILACYRHGGSVDADRFDQLRG